MECMNPSTSNESLFGMLAYVGFLLVAVFLGPLEAGLGLALYWLLGDDTEQGAGPR